MHYRLKLEVESARHDHRHVKQSVWQLHCQVKLRSLQSIRLSTSTDTGHLWGYRSFMGGLAGVGGVSGWIGRTHVEC